MLKQKLLFREKNMIKKISSHTVGLFLIGSIIACNSHEGELDGVWVSSKSHTLENVSKSMTLSDKHKAILGNLVGKMTHRIKGNVWTSTYDGIQSDSTFTITSKNENCYELLIESNKTVQACLYDDQLHLPSGIANVQEVFIKQ